MSYITFQPSDHFNTKLYSGTGSSNAITGVGFQPDWTWIKRRNDADDHVLIDAVRGASVYLKANATSGNTSATSLFSSLDSDGFTVTGTSGKTNNSGGTFASWNWKANGSGSSNTDGDITSTVSANTTAGFSIIKFTGNASTSQSFGHGLSGTPKIWFIKNITDGTDNWQVYFNGTDRAKLDTNEALEQNYLMSADSTTITTPSTSGGAWGNSSGKDFIVYAFQEIKGYSRFDKYLGNGNTDGTFVYTGFKPAMMIIKKDGTNNWYINDNKRLGYNPNNAYLFPDVTQAESDLTRIDIVSNGFKIRTTDGGNNALGTTYLYMAFAEHPIVSSNDIPAVAR